MFYRMIEGARDRWFQSNECTVKDIIAYTKKKGQLRDAQINAIKTYLYLKIACSCKPLAELFCEGAFNSCLDFDALEVSSKTRDFLKTHPEAVALFEYARLKNDTGEQVSRQLEDQIKKVPESIDYQKFFRDVFYDVSYSEYLFSLPMGLGKRG